MEDGVLPPPARRRIRPKDTRSGAGHAIVTCPARPYLAFARFFFAPASA